MHFKEGKYPCVNEQLFAYSKNSENDEEQDLEEMPVTVIGNLEQYQLATAIWIHGLRAK